MFSYKTPRKLVDSVQDNDEYDSSPDCFGDDSNDQDEDEDGDSEMDESPPSKVIKSEKINWVSLHKFFDTVGSLQDHYPSYSQLWHGKQKTILLENKTYYRYYVYRCTGHKKCTHKVKYFTHFRTTSNDLVTYS